MKKIYKLLIQKVLLFLMIGLLYFSCADDLQLEPLDSFSNETFWTSESNALMALTGVYSGNISHGVTAAPTDW